MLEEIVKKLDKNNEVYIAVKVMPNAPRSTIKGFLEDKTLKVDIKAVPENGKANIELIKLFSRIFSLKKENIKIISGAGTRKKLIKIFKT